MKFNMRNICSAVALCLGLAGSAFAADHAEAPAVLADPAADINDVYTFMNPNNADEIIFILTVFPNAGPTSLFSDAVSYNLLLEDDAKNQTTISCVFDDQIVQSVSCTGPNDINVSGLVDNILSDQDGMRVLFGLRDDPFFFDFSAFLQTVAPAENPGLGFVNPGTNNFAPNARFPQTGDTLAISIGLNRDLLPGFSSNNDVLRVYAATTRLDVEAQ